MRRQSVLASTGRSHVVGHTVRRSSAVGRLMARDAPHLARRPRIGVRQQRATHLGARPQPAMHCRVKPCWIELSLVGSRAALRAACGRRFFDGLLPSARPSAPAARATLATIVKLGRPARRLHH
jgi:hypothetical protein